MTDSRMTDSRLAPSREREEALAMEGTHSSGRHRNQNQGLITWFLQGIGRRLSSWKRKNNSIESPEPGAAPSRCVSGEPLIQEIEETIGMLKDVSNQFNLVGDDDLIEALIYQELSLEARYSFLMKQARDSHTQYQGVYAASPPAARARARFRFPFIREPSAAEGRPDLQTEGGDKGLALVIQDKKGTGQG